MEALKKFEEAVDSYIRPLTHPVAIKLLRSEADIPKGIETARKFYGHGIAGPCQGWAMARHNAESIAMLKDDIKCVIPVMAFGLVEPPEYFMNGDFYMMTGWYADNQEMAAKLAREMPRFPAGEYVGLVTAPIQTCDFEPDMVMVYCNPLQLLRFIGSVFSREGKRFEYSIWPYGICTLFIQVQQSGKCQLGIPCHGSRRYDATSFEEVIFVAPTAKLDEVTEGLKYINANQGKVATGRCLDYEPERPFWKILRSKWEESPGKS